MQVTIDRPTNNEWVIADPESLTHYYATVYPAGVMYQLILVELGIRGLAHYTFEREVYNCFFFSTDPILLANAIVNRFGACENRDFPIELVYAVGGHLEGMVIKSLPYSGDVQ